MRTWGRARTGRRRRTRKPFAPPLYNVYAAKKHKLIFLHSKRYLFYSTQRPNHLSDHLYDHLLDDLSDNLSDNLSDDLYDNLYDHLSGCLVSEVKQPLFLRVNISEDAVNRRRTLWQEDIMF